MLRVTVEIVPYGNEDEAHVIERMLIANVSTDDFNNANYDFIQTCGKERWAGQYNVFNRKWGAWSLIKNCLDSPDALDMAHEISLTETQKSLLERINSYE